MLQTFAKLFLLTVGIVLIEVGFGLSTDSEIENIPVFIVGWILCGISLMLSTARERRLERQINRMFQ